jgi:hypothetical protein
LPLPRVFTKQRCGFIQTSNQWVRQSFTKSFGEYVLLQDLTLTPADRKVCLPTATASPVLEHDRRISGDVFSQGRNKGPCAVVSRSSGGGAQDNHQSLTLIKGSLRQSAVTKNG